MKKFGTAVAITTLRNGFGFVVLDNKVEEYTLYIPKIQIYDVWSGMKLYELSFKDVIKEFFLENPEDNAVYYLRKMKNAERWRIAGNKIIYTKNSVEYDYINNI